jgi:hypothetical protein
VLKGKGNHVKKKKIQSAPASESEERLRERQGMSCGNQGRGQVEAWDGNHRDNFGENLETLSAVESQSRVPFKAMDFLDLLGGGGVGWPIVYLFQFRPYFTCGSFLSKIFDIFGDETDSNNQKSMEKSKISTQKNPRTKRLETFVKCLWFPKRKSYPRVWISTQNLKLAYGFYSLWFPFFLNFHLKKQEWASSVVFCLGEFFLSYMVYLTPADSF